jgi:hypothetical protein
MPLGVGCSLAYFGHTFCPHNTKGGTLIVSLSEFTGGTPNRTHLLVDAGAKKTIFTQNIISGKVQVEQKNKAIAPQYIVKDNADDA